LSLVDSKASEDAIEGALIAAIEGADPTFFPRFREAATSGDRLEIARMFQEAIDRGAEAAPTLGYQLTNDNTQLPIALAIVAVVFIAVVLVCCDPCLPNESAMSPLNREDYIDRIAARVALNAAR
jgi:hypothetical protein